MKKEEVLKDAQRLYRFGKKLESGDYFLVAFGWTPDAPIPKEVAEFLVTAPKQYGFEVFHPEEYIPLWLLKKDEEGKGIFVKLMSLLDEFAVPTKADYPDDDEEVVLHITTSQQVRDTAPEDIPPDVLLADNPVVSVLGKYALLYFRQSVFAQVASIERLYGIGSVHFEDGVLGESEEEEDDDVLDAEELLQ